VNKATLINIFAVIIDIEYQQRIKKNKKSENDAITIRKKITSDKDKPVGKNCMRIQ